MFRYIELMQYSYNTYVLFGFLNENIFGILNIYINDKTRMITSYRREAVCNRRQKRE